MNIAAVFPGMFTWRELLDMGLRQKSYWIRQVGAIRRQRIAEIAHGVSIGMAGNQADMDKAIEDLEFVKTAEESREERSKDTWEIIKVFGGGIGKGV